MVGASMAKNELRRKTLQEQSSSASMLMVRHEPVGSIHLPDSGNAHEIDSDLCRGINDDSQMDMDTDAQSDTTITEVEVKTSEPPQILIQKNMTLGAIQAETSILTHLL